MLSSFFCFVSIHVVHSYSSITTITGWKKSRFILSNRSDFHMTDSWLTEVHTFTNHTLASLSVDETLLMRYLNLSTNFRSPPLRVEMVLSYLKHMYCFICIYVETCLLQALEEGAGEARTNLSVMFFNGRATVGQPARTFLHQLCADTGCSFEDLPGALDDRDRECQGNPC